MHYCEEDELDNIIDELEDIRSECSDVEDEGVVTNIKGCCLRIENIVDSFREDDDLRDMIPEKLSVGAAISLKETLNKWRLENGYNEL